MSRRLATICLALLAAYPLGARAECTLAAATVMPMRVEQSAFFVPVQINGHDASLRIDTGSFATMLDLEAASRFGVKMGRMGSDVHAIGGNAELFRGTVSHMQLGQMNADGMVVGATTAWEGTENHSGNGLFGMNMMAAYDIDLDVPGHHFVLYEAQGACTHPTVALAQPLYMAHLLSVEHERQAVLEIVIDGRRIRAVLDTGATTTIMYRNTAARLGVDLSGLSDPAAHRVRGGGQLAVPTIKHVFPEVTIGDLVIHNMPITILAQKDSGVDRHHVGSLLEDPDEEGSEGMLLGADFMQMVHVWISHSSQTLILEYPPKPSPLGQ